MAQYITDLNVSINAAEEHHLQAHHYKKIPVDLNKGAGGNTIYLWYKHGSQYPITRLQATFNTDMADGLIRAGYTKIDKNLNAGAGGNPIYLWYYRGSGEFHTPIVGVDITTDAESDADKVSNGWERVSCDLNRNVPGNWIHVWVKREHQTYICDVTATDSYGSDTTHWNSGYIRMDEDTNRAVGRFYVFIWYRQTTDPKRALTDLQISTNTKEYDSFQQQNYQLVNVNLNEGTGGNTVYLWYKKVEGSSPIKATILLLQPDKVDVYKKKGVTVITKDLNGGNRGWIEFLCFYQ